MQHLRKDFPLNQNCEIKYVSINYKEKQITYLKIFWVEYSKISYFTK